VMMNEGRDYEANCFEKRDLKILPQEDNVYHMMG